MKQTKASRSIESFSSKVLAEYIRGQLGFGAANLEFELRRIERQLQIESLLKEMERIAAKMRQQDLRPGERMGLHEAFEVLDRRLGRLREQQEKPYMEVAKK